MVQFSTNVIENGCVFNEFEMNRQLVATGRWRKEMKFRGKPGRAEVQVACLPPRAVRTLSRYVRLRDNC